MSCNVIAICCNEAVATRRAHKAIPPGYHGNLLRFHSNAFFILPAIHVIPYTRQQLPKTEGATSNLNSSVRNH